jgi:hypothetical protein
VNPTVFSHDALFANLVDYEDLYATWKEHFAPLHIEALFDALSLYRKNPQRLPIEILLCTLHQRTRSSQVCLADLLYALEEAIEAEATYTLVSSLKVPRIDLFGEHVGNNWLRRLPSPECVHLHSSLPFVEHYRVLAQSKVLLCDGVHTPDGAPPWLLPALALDCLVVTPSTPYLCDLLGEDYPLFLSSLYDSSLAARIQEALLHREKLLKKISPALQKAKQRHAESLLIKILLYLADQEVEGVSN